MFLIVERTNFELTTKKMLELGKISCSKPQSWSILNLQVLAAMKWPLTTAIKIHVFIPDRCGPSAICGQENHIALLVLIVRAVI